MRPRILADSQDNTIYSLDWDEGEAGETGKVAMLGLGFVAEGLGCRIRSFVV